MENNKKKLTGLNVILTLIIFISAGSVLSAGDISGKVSWKQKTYPKSAQSYSGHGAHHSKNLMQVPGVVFIEGVVEGHPFPVEKKFLIVQKELMFIPSLLVIPVNAIVEFPNEDNEFHNVFSYSSTKRFDLGRYPKGEFKTMQFNKPGIVKVYCEVHPWMRAAILVLENPFYAQIKDDGSFLIPEVPAGEYTLIIWDIDNGIKRKSITVPADGLEIISDFRGK